MLAEVVYAVAQTMLAEDILASASAPAPVPSNVPRRPRRGRPRVPVVALARMRAIHREMEREEASMRCARMRMAQGDDPSSRLDYESAVDHLCDLHEEWSTLVQTLHGADVARPRAHATWSCTTRAPRRTGRRSTRRTRSATARAPDSDGDGPPSPPDRRLRRAEAAS
jgi:hypothetical protein